VPALNPDVTILHAQRADRAGNVALHGIVGAQREAAMAATALIVTVEEIVDALPPAMNAIVLPHWVVARRALPGRAYPSYAHGIHARQRLLPALGRDRARARDVHAWMQRHVLDTADHAASSPASAARPHDAGDAR
jgi:glutaconate CoA-transferase subunit A